MLFMVTAQEINFKTGGKAKKENVTQEIAEKRPTS